MNIMKKLPRILIVDDIDLNREALRDLCVILGYDPVLVDSGQAALDAMEQMPLDLVLLDIVMPEIEGPEIVRQLKEDPELSKIKVAYFSSLISSREDASRRRLGNLPFVKKPSSSKELVESVRLLWNG